MVEVHAIPSWRRSNFYASVPKWWGIKPSRHLVVQSQLVFANYPNCVFDGGLYPEAFMKIDVSEFLMMKTMYLVSAAREGIILQEPMDRRV